MFSTLGSLCGILAVAGGWAIEDGWSRFGVPMVVLAALAYLILQVVAAFKDMEEKHYG